MSSPDSRRAYGEHSPYIQRDLGGLVSRISWKARRAMFRSLNDVAGLDSSTSVLDVGVTNDRRLDSNFFEQLHPHPQNVVAVGLEDFGFLRQRHPRLKFCRADGLELPFADQTFDLVVSFAVIEHIGSRARQRAFLHELCRVGRACFVTTPNRWFPIEFHTLLPFAHWLPPVWFRRLARTLGQGFFAQEANLNLLSDSELRSMLPDGSSVATRHHRMLGGISNLAFYVVPRARAV